MFMREARKSDSKRIDTIMLELRKVKSENIALKEQVISMEKYTQSSQTDENTEEINRLDYKLEKIEDEINTIKGALMIHVAPANSSCKQFEKENETSEATNALPGTKTCAEVTKTNISEQINDNIIQDKPANTHNGRRPDKNENTKNVLSPNCETHGQKIETLITEGREKADKIKRKARQRKEHIKNTGNRKRAPRPRNYNYDSTTYIGNHTNNGRIKVKRYYIGCISRKSTEEGLRQFLYDCGVKPVELQMFRSRSGNKAAKLTVPSQHGEILEDRAIWPDFVYCRQWLSKEKWSNYKNSARNSRSNNRNRQIFNKPVTDWENNENSNHQENYEDDWYSENVVNNDNNWDENEEDNNWDDDYWGNEGNGDDFDWGQQTDSWDDVNPNAYASSIID